MPLTLQETAQAIRASRTDFARVFLEAQPPGPPAVAFEAVAVSASQGTDADAFAIAVVYAAAHQFLEPLVFLLCEAGFESGALLRDLANEASQREDLGDLDLQAMQNLQRGLAEPDVVVRGMKRAMRLTTRICIDGGPAGTGLLVGPDLVLTAWHVVAPLFSQQNGVHVPKSDAGSRLEIELDNVLEVITKTTLAPRRRKILKAHSDWCVRFSPCHALELKNDLPQDLGELEGFWDYALLRLATAPGAERSWIPLDRPQFVPLPAQNVTVFQHAGGQSLRFDEGAIIGADEDTKRRGIGVKRFLHAVNTENGSSGGPCFDRNYVLIGIHQGVWSRTPENPPNRGIPLARIVRDVGVLPQSAGPSSCIWRLSPPEPLVPVLGADEFQRSVWSSVVTPTARVLVLRGDRGVGKSFLVQVLVALLPPAGHLAIGLPASQISNSSAPELAQQIARAAGAELGAIAPAVDMGSTSTIWLRDELLQKLLTALDVARNGRSVWLCLQDLNKTELRGPNASEFLLMFYEAALPRPWLRIVLDGMRGDLPATLNALTEVRRIEWLDEKSARQAVTDFVLRAVVAPGDPADPNEPAAKAGALAAARAYMTKRDEDPTKAMEALARAAIVALKDYRTVMEEP